MSKGNKLHQMELGGTIKNACCTECGHVFQPGEEILITGALCKVVDGKLVIDDHAPSIICFPGDSDGHYTDDNN